ncbi:hypothetical protein [Chamaesiphon sp. OTE_20_metabat_361]|uniref:hypothetical protein n=1 Tax=Chamaesiphon sp. OTE_20_metabat_361 TaxID=2964689 RepID=UPI00286BAB9F|nr:hypothetical protein [Chamaesiphon sp. OTE_20_metabat_361]
MPGIGRKSRCRSLSSGESRGGCVRTANIKQNSWDLDAVLPIDYVLTPQQLALVPPAVYTNFCHLLDRDVYSEGDAQSLYDYMTLRAAEMSPEFLAMLDLWLADELKHYEALRRTYHCIAGVQFAEMNRQFARRVHEIEPIAMVLTDEFTFLVTLMFDEIGSVYSYRRDLWEYYRHFGTAIHKIGHHLVKDEGMHFSNAAELLLANHQPRLGEVPKLLEQIANLEQNLHKYHQTFFLDHAQERYRFPPHFNSAMIQLILERLGLSIPTTDRAQRRTQGLKLRELWQWAPTGYHLVPIFTAPA